MEKGSAPPMDYIQAKQDMPPSYEQSIAGGFIPPQSYPPQPLNYHSPHQNYPSPTQTYFQLPQNYPPPPQNHPPPPLSYHAPPQNYPPAPAPVQQVVVQTVQAPSLGHRSVTMTCPHCQNRVKTSIESETSALACAIGGVLCLAGFWCCACFPFCIDSLKNVTHTCPSCKKVLGKYKGNVVRNTFNI